MKQIQIVLLLLCVVFVSVAQKHEDNRKFINLEENVNSKTIELNPHISADGKTLYYVREDHPDNKNFQEIWVSKKDDNGNWTPAVRLDKPLNMDEANSIASVSNDGNRLMIKGFYEKGKLKGPGYSFTRRTSTGWSVPEGIHVDGYKELDLGLYNNACITNDDKVIIFSFANAKNSKQNDLWVSFKVTENHYSTPVKIAHICAPNHMDFAPFIASDNKTLYFSSDRPEGHGETDIYKVVRHDTTWLNWSVPINLGTKINGPGRDGYYVLDAEGSHAYLVSDKNSIGLADIVMIELEASHKPEPVVLVRGNVYDAKTKQPLQAKVEYYNFPSEKNRGVEQTDPNTGKYTITFPYGGKHIVSAGAAGYVASFDTLSFKKVGLYHEIVLDFYLTPIQKGEKIILKHVNFATNSAVIEVESYPELDKVVEFLNQNPTVKIQISGHTDNEGNMDKNKILSENRAKSVYEYLLNKGIAATRISSKGYGQTQPIVPNSTAENKRTNRRVEFEIIEN